MGSLFEQHYPGTPWFRYYFTSQQQFATNHGQIVESKRWLRPCRPRIWMCLGRWHISTYDQQLYVASSSMEAFVMVGGSLCPVRRAWDRDVCALFVCSGQRW